jgi:tetratricopeptide (TPR) repeat protein
MLDCELFGLDAGSHHLVSVALHALNAVLLFVVIMRMTRQLGPSLFVAALFALHPMRVESVAWASERKDVLSGLFWMLTLLAWTSYVRRPGIGRYLVVALTFTLGLMAKPMLVTLPFVLLLLDAWPLARVRRGQIARVLLEKLPLLLLAGVSSLVTIQAQQGAVSSMAAVGLEARLANALSAYVAYIQKTIWPRGLAVYYPHDIAQGSASPWGAAAIGSALVLLAVSALALVRYRRSPYLTVGWLWFLGTLVPVIGIVQVGTQAMADRYTYLPLIGIYLAVAFGAREVLASRPALRTPAIGAALFAILGYAAVCWQQVGLWSSDETLFAHAVSVTERNYQGHYSLGNALERKGDVQGAAREYEEALRIYPNYFEARANLGGAWAQLGRLDAAEQELSRALAMDPAHAESHNNLGNVYNQRGQLERAAAEFRAALLVEPDLVEAHNNLGITLASMGKLRQAAASFEHALSLDPSFQVARDNLARARQMLGQ